MKRFLSLLLSFCLLFSLFGCGKIPPAEPETTTAAPAPTGEPTTAPKSEKAVFRLDSLPEIGSFVSDEKKACFFDDGPHADFEPRDDYGTIVPYAPLTEKYFAAEWSYTDWETGETVYETTDKGEEEYMERFGFATVDGKIITDALYEDVLEETAPNGETIYIALPRRNYEMTGTMDIIGSDGSWMLRFGEETEFRNLDYRVWTYKPMFMVLSDKQAAIYDYSGKKIVDITRHCRSGGYLPDVFYVSRDLLLVQKEVQSGDDYFFEYRLFDYDGNLVAALPKTIDYIDEVCSENVMIAADEDRDRFLADIHGKALTDGRGEIWYDAKTDLIFAGSDYDGNEIDLVDPKTGKTKRTIDLPIFTQQRGEDGFWLFDDGERMFYDLNGKPKRMDTDGREIVKIEVLSDWQYTTGLADVVLAATADDTLYLFDKHGNRLAVLKDVEYQVEEPYDYYDDDDEEDDEDYDDEEETPIEKNYQVYLSANHVIYMQNGRVCVRWLHSEKERSFPLTDPDNYSGVSFHGDRIYDVAYRMTDMWQSESALYDFTTGNCLLQNVISISRFGDRILAVTKTHSYMMDLTGKILLCLKNDKLV